MNARLSRDIDRLAADVGADGWVLVRQSRHLVIEFVFADVIVREVMAKTPSDHRANVNCRAHLRRQVRRAA